MNGRQAKRARTTSPESDADSGAGTQPATNLPTFDPTLAVALLSACQSKSAHLDEIKTLLSREAFAIQITETAH